MIKWIKQKFAVNKPERGPDAKVLPMLWDPISENSLSAQILALPDPDVILRKAGISRSALRKLTFDDEIYQAISTRENGLMIVPLRLEPTESKESKFIQTRCLSPEFVKALIGGAFAARLYGYSVMEIVWDKDVYNTERAFVPRDISQRNIEYFVVRPDGTLVQMIRNDIFKPQMINPTWQERIKDIPGAEYTAVVLDTDYKFLLTRNESTWDNPYGEALLSRVYWPWFFRQKTWHFYGQYLERYAVPMLVGHGENVQFVAEELAKAQHNAIIAVHIEDKVEALNVNGAGQTLYSAAEDMLVRRIEKVILGQTLTSGTDGGSGNRALGQVHNTVREDKVKADIELIRPTLQKFVNACHTLNGFKGEPPEVVFGDDRQLAKERAERDAILIQHGIVGGFSEDYLMDNYGFRPGEFTMPEKPSINNPTEVIEVEEYDGQRQEEERQEKRPRQFSFAASRVHPNELELLSLEKWAIKQGLSPYKVEDLLMAIEESESPEELVTKLAKIDIDPNFAQLILNTNISALSLGGKANRKNV
jgi:hypothetical protein